MYLWLVIHLLIYWYPLIYDLIRYYAYIIFIIIYLYIFLYICLLVGIVYKSAENLDFTQYLQFMSDGQVLCTVCIFPRCIARVSPRARHAHPGCLASTARDAAGRNVLTSRPARALYFTTHHRTLSFCINGQFESLLRTDSEAIKVPLTKTTNNIAFYRHFREVSIF